MSDELLELEESDFDLLEELPVCGCGNPEMVYGLYQGMLRVMEDADGVPSHGEMLSIVGGDTRLFYVAAYVLDDIEATEHGGSIWGAWITEKGCRLLAVLDRYEESGFKATPTVPSDQGSE